MTEITFQGRQAARLENEFLRVTVLQEGGHIAEVFDKRAGRQSTLDPALDFDGAITIRPPETRQYGTGSGGQTAGRDYGT